MNLVVDTNIVFSALLNPSSPSGEILMDFDQELKFFAPKLMLEEISKYLPKIERYTKLPSQKLIQIQNLIFSIVEIVSEEEIKSENWVRAFEILDEVDQDDIPFLALAYELDCLLWTGDKKLIKAGKPHIPKTIIDTQHLKKLLQ